jgi:hypothetical protein
MPVIVFHGTTDVFPKDIEEIIVQHPSGTRSSHVWHSQREMGGNCRRVIVRAFVAPSRPSE